jgi:hypothetical protein
MLPNFLVIGAGKSGTSSIYEHLREHPQVFMSPVKEPNFFAWDPETPGRLAWGSAPHREYPVTDLDAYRALFDGAGDEIAVGEASTVYLEAAGVPSRVAETLDSPRFIVSLRNPVERAYSGHWMAVRHGWKHPPFEEAFEPHQDLIEAGRYPRLLRRWFLRFPPDRFHILLFEDLKSSPVQTMQAIYRFLGVDPEFKPAVRVKHNRGGVPRYRFWDSVLAGKAIRPLVAPWLPAGAKRLARRVRSRNLAPVPPMTPELRRRLTDFYRDDILDLQSLIDRDLGSWLEPPGASSRAADG